MRRPLAWEHLGEQRSAVVLVAYQLEFIQQIVHRRLIRSEPLALLDSSFLEWANIVTQDIFKRPSSNSVDQSKPRSLKNVVAAKYNWLVAKSCTTGFESEAST